MSLIPCLFGYNSPVACSAAIVSETANSAVKMELTDSKIVVKKEIDVIVLDGDEPANSAVKKELMDSKVVVKDEIEVIVLDADDDVDTKVDDVEKKSEDDVGVSVMKWFCVPCDTTILAKTDIKAV